MPIVSILIVLATFIFIFLVGLYIYLIFYNKQTRTVTERFIKEANKLSPVVFQNIKLRYWTSGRYNIVISPNKYCDLYLFDSCVALVRRQEFVFRVFFAPVLFASDIATTKNMFDYLYTYKLDRIAFKQIINGQIDIRLIDPIYKHYTIDITLKGLTNEQANQLKKIENWC